jgi:hypothetical protein
LADRRLIFLACQPRSGSTLTQKILAKHSAITTCSEPWLMLLAAAPIAQSRTSMTIDEDLARIGVSQFMELLPNKKDDLIEAIRRYTSGLYEKALNDEPDRYFLDKTPRYYRIIPELIEIFPNSKIIVLVRNPMAVLASILTTWAHPGYGGLFRFRDDLLEAPRLLADALDLGTTQLYKLRYEDLLEAPEATIENLCGFIGIDYERDMTRYGESQEARWLFGDQVNVYQWGEINSANANKWKDAVCDPRVWRIFREYADLLGKHTLEQFGYNWHEIDQVLVRSKPRFDKRKFAISLEAATSSPRLMSIKQYSSARMKDYLAKKSFLWTKKST